MPDRLTDVKAEFLLDQGNRRARLLGIVQKTLPRYWSLLPATLLIVAILAALMLIQAILRESGLISPILLLAVCSIISIASDVATLNKQVDALVELLREEGILQGTPPVAKLLDKQ